MSHLPACHGIVCRLKDLEPFSCLKHDIPAPEPLSPDGRAASSEQFRARFDELHPYLAGLWVGRPLLVAGEIVASILMDPERPHRGGMIDFFLAGSGAPEEFVAQLGDTLRARGNVSCCRTESCVVFRLDDGESCCLFRAMLAVAPSVSHVLESYGLGHNSVAWDGQNVLFCGRSAFAATHGVELVTGGESAALLASALEHGYGILIPHKDDALKERLEKTDSCYFRRWAELMGPAAALAGALLFLQFLDPESITEEHAAVGSAVLQTPVVFGHDPLPDAPAACADVQKFLETDVSFAQVIRSITGE